VTGGGDRNGAKKGYEVEDGRLHGFWSGCFRAIRSDAVCRFDVPRASRLPYLPRHGARHHSRPTPERALAATGDDFPHETFNPKTFAPVSTNSYGEDIEDVLARPHARGAELVGELEQYEDRDRLCCVRGPEGIIVALPEQHS